MLISAAAARWKVDPTSCRAERGVILHLEGGQRLGYGEVADSAALLPVPAAATVPLKDPKDFTLIGTAARRLDGQSKVDGSAQFSIDVRLPGMKIATVAASPVFGGTLATVDDTRAKAIRGVRQVVRLPNAVAVVADQMWAAQQGLAALTLTWNEGEHAGLSTEEVVRRLEAASQKDGAVAREEGDVDAKMGAATTRVEAIYQVPFLAHATMEPVNCTVEVRADGCDVWVGTQIAGRAQAEVARVTGLSRERVQIHNHLIGGGFGRRLEVDFIVQAAQIARQVDGPVKVVWTREEDIRHDMYRPYYFDRIAAGLDAAGTPVAWSHRITGSSILGRWLPKSLAVIRASGIGATLATLKGVDLDAVDGAVALPYALPNIRVAYVREEPPGIPTAFWRGVGPTHNIFVVESFMDELALAAQQDPVAYRRALLGDNPRALAVLDLAASAAGWGEPLPAGHGRGVALQHVFGTYLAEVAEVEVTGAGTVRVHRVVVAADCGVIVNPDTVRAQLEGGVIFGIGAALYNQITLRNGRVEQSNFHDYRMLRMHEAPRIEVHLVSSGEAPGGVGEPGTSAIAPALANAVFAATGKRIRTLPIEGGALRAS
jgi:isoquinoline 1-oxidoreductase beta subunit